MVDVNLRATAVSGGDIEQTDVLFAADPTEADASASFKSDTFTEVIAKIFQNPPSSLTAAQATALRTLLAIPAAGGGATLRFGTGVPANSLGANGDSYLDTNTGSFYLRASDAYTVQVTVARLAGATFTGAVTIGSSSGGPLEVNGENAGNSTIMKIFTPDTGTQKAFGAGREGEFDWVQFAGEIVTGKPGFALGPGTARDTNLYRQEANHLRTDDEFSADEISIHGTLADTQDNLGVADANPAGADGDLATRLVIRGTNYNLPDDVVDVTDTGLPALTADNYKRLFIDHDTPRVWVGHREIIAMVDAVGTFAEYTDTTAPNFRGVVSGISPPSSLLDGEYYYALGNHGWWRGVQTHGIIIGRQVAFRTLFPTADWLGEQPDGDTAAGLVDSFDTTRQYLFYNSGSGDVELLDNSTYVAATDRIEHFTAEPLGGAAGVVGAITGVTAGAGLDGGGSSGVVSLAVDPTAADFPTIPVNKGGTGAETAVAALAALLGAPLASPTFTGVPLTPTPAAGTNTTQIASTAYVVTAIAAALLGGGADGVLASAALQADGVTLRLTLSTGTTIDVNLTTLISGLISAVATPAAGGLEGGGTTGDLSLAIAAGGVTFSMLATAAVTQIRSTLAPLAGAVFTGVVSGITPTAAAHLTTKAYVDAAIASGVTPTPTHTSYVGVSMDTMITEAEAQAGTSGTGNALAIPAYTDSQHVFFARPASEGAFTAVYLYADGSPNTQNQISAWTTVTGTIDIGGEAHNVIYSTAVLDGAGGFIVEVV